MTPIHCGGVFVVGAALPEGVASAVAKKKAGEHVPNAGFRIYEGEKGQIYVRLFSYARYLNQKGLDPEYTDAFGHTHSVKHEERLHATHVCASLLLQSLPLSIQAALVFLLDAGDPHDA